MVMRGTSEMSGQEKAAVLLISLGPETSAKVYKHLTEEEIENLTLEISNMRKVEHELKDQVVEQFHQIIRAQDYISQGGLGYAKSILEKALGKKEAMDIVNRLNKSLQVRPFQFARKADPNQVLNFIQDEHPQTIALILSYLDPPQAGQILSELPHEMQTDVAKRIALMDGTSSEIINEVESTLEKKLSTAVSQDYTHAGGVASVVEVLNSVDRSTEKTILDELDNRDPELSEDIKKRMFVFEDIVTLDHFAIQRVIREINNQDMILSLKAASDEVKAIIFQNMSQRMSETMKEEMTFLGPVRLREVEEAQMNIVSTIRRLEDAGEVVIARGGGDDVIV